LHENLVCEQRSAGDRMVVAGGIRLIIGAIYAARPCRNRCGMITKLPRAAPIAMNAMDGADDFHR